MPDLQDYKLNLDNYYGPLDLLLHLVKETEVDVTGIALARVCEQYIGFLTAAERLDIELSGNFLSLASQLLLIKARSLAPVERTGDEEEVPEGDEQDASLELIRKLLDYKRFKDRARALNQMGAERARRFGRPRLKLEREPDPGPLRNLELWDLVLLYSRVLKGTRLDASLSILYKDVPIEIFIEKILRTLTEKRRTDFSELVGDPTDRTRVVGTFLAMLQLAKEQKLTIEQDGDKGEIRVELAEIRSEDRLPVAGDPPPPAEEPPAPGQTGS